MKRERIASGFGSDADLDVTRAARSRADELYREHAVRVLAVCRGLLRDGGEAEDAAQQVFVSALRALLGGTEPRDSEAWLVTIARRECWARARNGSTVVADSAPEASREDDALAAVIRREQVRSTLSAIADLPAAQRQAFLLREVRGLHYDELAADLRVSEASIRSLLSRARRTVRTCVERSAALIGASWLNALARVFGDGTNSAVSAAGKTAAVGLGALALGGGTLVAPRFAPHPHTTVKPAPLLSVGSGNTHAVRAAAAAQVASEPSRPAATVVVLARAGDGAGDHRQNARRAAGVRVHEGGRRPAVTSRGDGGSSGGSGSSRDGGTSGDGSGGTTSAAVSAPAAGSSGSGDAAGSSDGSGSNTPSVTAARPGGEGGSGDAGPSSGSSDGGGSGVVAFTGASSGAGAASSTDTDHGGSDGSGGGGGGSGDG